MTTSIDKTSLAHPRSRAVRTLHHLDINDLIVHGDAAPGTDARKLSPGDTVVMHTRNTSYTLRLENPARCAGIGTSDGKHVTEESDMHILGATLSGRGTLVKLGWILLGFRMVLLVPGRELLTTPVQSLSVNGQPLVVAPGTH